MRLPSVANIKVWRCPEFAEVSCQSTNDESGWNLTITTPVRDTDSKQIDMDIRTAKRGVRAAVAAMKKG